MAKLHFYYSAMNAGKSTTLLQSSHNYNERGMGTLLYAPRLVLKTTQEKITSRIGLEASAIGFDQFFDIYSNAKRHINENPNIKCILVDEAQFLNKQQVAQLCLITDELNLPVLAYGIRTDFKGEPFEGSLYLLAWADILVEIKTICHCGRKATMNVRIDHNGRQVFEGAKIEIGGNDRYLSTCRKHFNLQIFIKESLKEKEIEACT